MTSILGLDCSKFVGRAFFRSADDKAPLCKTWQAKDTWLSEDYGSYFAETEEHVVDLLMTFNPEVVAFESPLLLARIENRGTDEQNIRRLVGVVSIIEKVCHQRGVKCMEVNVSTAKSFMGVPTRKPKDMSWGDYKSLMIIAVTEFGYEVADSHQADAIAVALCVYSDLEGPDVA